jgi:predicted enzyme related to lactoylglutathione lyase
VPRILWRGSRLAGTGEAASADGPGWGVVLNRCGHLGVEADFRPARKAHPTFAVRDLDELAARLMGAGAAVEFDDAIPGLRRFYTADPVGNRIEFLEER